MLTPRNLFPVLAVAAFLSSGCGNARAGTNPQVATPAASNTMTGNPITGEGLPNPAPNVTRNWGQLPTGRKWGSSAGIDIDPIDGHIWAYERCGAGTFGAGAPVTCDSNPVDPVFKFD